MEWLVKIIGNNSDLEKLCKSSSSSEYSITEDVPQEGGGFILKSKHFNSLKNYDGVKGKAKEILSEINGGLRLLVGFQRTLKMGNIYNIDDDGNRATIIMGSGGITFGGSADIEFEEPNGTVRKYNPTEPIPRWITIAQQDKNVFKVLNFLGADTIDWRILYNIYDTIKKDIGGSHNLIERGWATEEVIDCFKRTPQSWDAVGVEARHGKDIPAPENPMSISKAKSLIKDISLKWLRSKEKHFKE